MFFPSACREGGADAGASAGGSAPAAQVIPEPGSLIGDLLSMDIGGASASGAPGAPGAVGGAPDLLGGGLDMLTGAGGAAAAGQVR